MKKANNLLPDKPTYEECCHLIDYSPDDYWSQTLEHLKQKHNLPEGAWIRINEGGNVLFKLNDALIVKIVPPSWGYQGIAEIESSKLLAGKLSIPIPEVIAKGTINNWVYIIMTLLPGVSLADIWNTLSIEQKHPIVRQVGQFMRELHLLPVEQGSPLYFDWSTYSEKLINDCVPRHIRKGVPQPLVEQIPAYLSKINDYFDDGDSFFIHMDLHPWNLMVEKVNQEYIICGVLDFGDAIIGRSRLLEIATPILFLCQGNKSLIDALIKSYQLLPEYTPMLLQKKLMAVSLLRPACDFNFVLSQVPVTGPRDNWEQISQQLFPA